MIEEIKVTDGRANITLTGAIKAEDFLSVIEQIKSHQDFPLIRYQLWRTDADATFSINGKDLNRILVYARAQPTPNPALKIAVVAGSSLAFGLGRMYEAFTGEAPWKLSIFSTDESAETWFQIQE